MSSDYCLQPSMFDRIHNFAVAGANNELTENHWSDFERLLQENDDAFRLYIEYMEESDLLRAVMDAIPDDDSASPDVFPLVPEYPASVPIPTFLPTTLHNPLNYLPESWSVSYMIATVICGIGILIGAFTYVSHPVQVARELPAVMKIKDHVASDSRGESVGRITGMVDCNWAEGNDPAFGNYVVPLGRKLKIESGLVEIDYDTGAKVILQGPVDYVVESKNGGFLAAGKMIGSVTTANAKGFSVRTPTATVTDLGTEFAVDVSESGASEVHVFSGMVIAESTGREGVASRQMLTAGRAVRIEAGRTDMIPKTACADRFVRSIPHPQPMVQWIGPLLYQSFENHAAMPNISPFSTAAGGPFGPLVGGKGRRHWTGPAGQYFYLEDLGSGTIRAPGLSVQGGRVVGAGITVVGFDDVLADSVDEDDGVIDGGNNGAISQSVWHWSGDGKSLILDFDAAVLGSLPTHMGFVITDCVPEFNTVIEIFDASHRSLGEKKLYNAAFSADTHTSGPNQIKKARFVGVVCTVDGQSAGISSVVVSQRYVNGRPAPQGRPSDLLPDPLMSEVNHIQPSGFEVDHIQYGFAAARSGRQGEVTHRPQKIIGVER